MPADRQPVPRLWWLAPAAVFVTLLLLETTDVDRAVSHWFYDTATGTFPLRHTFLFDTVLHHWTKYVVIMIASMVIATWLLSHVLPALRAQRRRLLFLALALSVAPLTVSALKLATNRPCPWDFADYGGAIPYTHLFEKSVPHARGQCFPAGHASTGFALLGFFFVAHHARRRNLAHMALLLGLTGGVALGMGRVAQGAHFVSHVLWSGLVCWLVMLLLYKILLAPVTVPKAATGGSFQLSG